MGSWSYQESCVFYCESLGLVVTDTICVQWWKFFIRLTTHKLPLDPLGQMEPFFPLNFPFVVALHGDESSVAIFHSDVG
jgi:hypothetical protein